MSKLSGTAWLVIVGILIGPAYYFYCEMFTGRVVAKGSDSILRVELGPDMNPVGILAHGSSERYTRGFNATLYLNRKQIWQKSFSISSHKALEDRRFETVGLGTLKVSAPGTYELVVSGTGSVELEVRRNAREANMVVVWAGVVMLALGLLSSIVSRRENAGS